MITILGASGDLAKRKTYPALCTLHAQGFLPQNCKVLGYARSALTNESHKETIKPYLKGTDDEIDAFLDITEYIPGQYCLAHEKEGPSVFKSLCDKIEEYESSRSTCNRVFYLALPPSIYPEVCANIKSECTQKTKGWTRIILEKPFGRDLESSEELNKHICSLYREDQLYRIDHYLGKELVQNLVVMRFANRLFTPIWNRDNISNIQIIFKEKIGCEGRGGYFDKYGIVRDIIQNHLIQVMALLAMERPCSLSADDIRDEKLKVLRCTPPLTTDNIVTGQYLSGVDADGNHKKGYAEDETVPNDSKCPTFAMCVLFVNNERWQGVPFILKAGKALNESKVEIRVQLRDVPGDLFLQKSAPKGTQTRNELVVRLQPDPSIYMKMTVKEPGLETSITQSEMELLYTDKYKSSVIPEAYERLILDCLYGEQQHFRGGTSFRRPGPSSLRFSTSLMRVAWHQRSTPLVVAGHLRRTS